MATQRKPPTPSEVIRLFISVDGQSAIANAIKIGRSSFGRKFNGEQGWTFEEIDRLFGHLGLAVVEIDGEMVTIPKKEHEALITLAKKGIDNCE